MSASSCPAAELLRGLLDHEQEPRDRLVVAGDLTEPLAELIRLPDAGAELEGRADKRRLPNEPRHRDPPDLRFALNQRMRQIGEPNRRRNHRAHTTVPHGGANALERTNV